MKRLFAMVWVFVFMAITPVFADNTCYGRIENYVSATGTVMQNGTPSPTNPIEPVFYKQGDMVLRKVGNIADSYDATTGKITRRIGMMILTGTEYWKYVSGSNYSGFQVTPNPALAYRTTTLFVSTHFPGKPYSAQQNPSCGLIFSSYMYFNNGTEDVAAWKQWLAQQYAAGTPVVVYYPLATETTEDIGTTYCVPEIKIATTAYNTAQFNPVVTDLNSTIATIRDVVTNTINQTAAIADLQAKKQTRPDEQCPAGKKCLLVETEENGVIVPHWYPIIEAPED
jgi:hypothetical protein